MKGAGTRDSYGLVAIVTATSSIPCDMCANSCGRSRGEGEQLRSELVQRSRTPWLSTKSSATSA